ncbi:MAG: cation-translocating P-type ATPase [candidate division WOR-3 bacterium]
MTKIVKLPVRGITCLNCARTVKNVIKNYENVKSVDVDLVNEVVTIEFEKTFSFKRAKQELLNIGYEILTKNFELYIPQFDEKLENYLLSESSILTYFYDFESKTLKLEISPIKDLDDVLRDINKLGYKAHLLSEGKGAFDIEFEERKKELNDIKTRAIFSSILSIPLLLHEFSMPLNPIIQLILTIPIQFYFGGYFIKNAIKSIRAKNLDMNVLISLGTLSAFFGSFLHFINPEIFHHVYFSTSAIIISIILIGKFFETRAKFKVFENLKNLYVQNPKKVIVLNNNNELEIDISDLKEGDIFVVKEGFLIPADGIIIQGEGYLDESAFSGETKLIKKSKNDEVFQGTILREGYLKVKALRVGSNTLFSEILKISRYAQREKSSLESLANKVSSVFTPTVVVFSIIVFIFWFIKSNFEIALLKLISVLVIACPCAIGIAIPLVIAASINKSLKNGIIIKNSASLERANKINVVVFDKTGTLTEGKLKLKTNIPYEHLVYLASLEKLNEHPISKAILDNYNGEFLNVNEFEYIRGEGIKGIVNNKKVIIGNKKLFEKEKLIVNFDLGYYIEGYGAFELIFEDKIKEDAKKLINILKKNYRIIVLSGDSYENVRNVCKELKIDEFYSNLNPFEKLKFVEDLKKEGNKILYVGDGINDAIVLSKADLSIAVSNALDIVKESGDIILIKSDIYGILKAFEISKIASSKMKWNLFWTFFYNIILIPFAGFYIHFHPIYSAIAMALSDIFVLSNSIYNWRISSKNPV